MMSAAKTMQTQEQVTDFKKDLAKQFDRIE